MWSALRRCLRWAGMPPAWLLIGAVRAYQIFVSPLLPSTCRFQPSCSEYVIEAIQKKGPLLGLLKGLWRLARCNPCCRGGYDPVQKRPEAPPSQPARRDSFNPRRM